jgi:hypothetical protein
MSVTSSQQRLQTCRPHHVAPRTMQRVHTHGFTDTSCISKLATDSSMECGNGNTEFPKSCYTSFLVTFNVCTRLECLWTISIVRVFYRSRRFGDWLSPSSGGCSGVKRIQLGPVERANLDHRTSPSQ